VPIFTQEKAMNRNTILAVAAVVILGIAALGTVHAQQWGGFRHHHMMSDAAMRGGHMGYGHHMGGWMGNPRWSMCGMTRHIDGRLAFLKAELKITPDQEQLWNDYASAVRTNAESMQDRCDEIKKAMEDGNRPPLPERLDLRTQMMEAKLEALRTKGKALKPLYDALSDDQKKTADELIRL
jgi:hypothetical protein